MIVIIVISEYVWIVQPLASLWSTLSFSFLLKSNVKDSLLASNFKYMEFYNLFIVQHFAICFLCFSYFSVHLQNFPLHLFKFSNDPNPISFLKIPLLCQQVDYKLYICLILCKLITYLHALKRIMKWLLVIIVIISRNLRTFIYRWILLN